MLRLNAERIFDALAHGEMPYGKEGLVRDTQGLAMDDPSLTVRHVDLKAWMAHYYPGEKPTFLFDEIERALHPAISLDTVGALLVEREAIKARLAEHLGVLETLRAEHEALLKTHAACAADTERANTLGPRSESTYLNIVGGLLTLLLGKSPSGMPYSSFLTQEAIISAMVAHHGNAMGITERTLQAKFRSEEHTSELQSLMRISYAVFCLKKKKIKKHEKNREYKNQKQIININMHNL